MLSWCGIFKDGGIVTFVLLCKQHYTTGKLDCLVTSQRRDCGSDAKIMVLS